MCLRQEFGLPASPQSLLSSLPLSRDRDQMLPETPVKSQTTMNSFIECGYNSNIGSCI